MTPIKNEADYARALARAKDLWHVAPGTPEAAELDAIAEAIEAYESIELDRELPPAQPGPLIAFKLRELGLSQNELARRTELSSGRVSEIINGRRGMTLDHVRRISAALGIDPSLLVHDSSPPAEHAVAVHVDARLVNAARAQNWLDHPSIEALVNAALSNMLCDDRSRVAVAEVAPSG